MDRLHSGLDARRVMHMLSSNLDKERKMWKPVIIKSSGDQVCVCVVSIVTMKSDVVSHRLDRQCIVNHFMMSRIKEYKKEII